MTPAPARWQLNPRIRLHWRDWGHDSVAFESLSGTTHQFDPLAAAVLAWIENAPQSTRTLAALLAQDAGIADAQPLHEGIAATLEMLDRLGWIVPEDAMAPAAAARGAAAAAP